MNDEMKKYFPHYHHNKNDIFTSVMFTLNKTTITTIVKDKKTKNMMEKIVKLDDSMKDVVNMILDTVDEFKPTPLQL
jgi:Asp-tRNA(Asn)/Glu-tRNA(Gln) amidotransferase B subunit